MTQAVDTSQIAQAGQTAISFVEGLLSSEDISDLRAEEFQTSSDGALWLITVGFLRPATIQPLKYLTGVSTRFRDYKVVAIDKNTREPVSMRDRESA